MRSASPAAVSGLTLSVVIPVWNGGAHLARCLTALAKSARKPDEIIVVNDGSDDDSASVAHAAGTKLIEIADGPGGPAAARNRGVRASSGEVIVFLDCDVFVHPETLGMMEEKFAANPRLAGLFGSYDNDPTEPALVSRYRNLLHHYVHQHGSREASTFWAGCGAIRREVFEAENGFDETYRWASIEDIELGLRLHDAGHQVLLCSEVQATHGKQWAFWEMIHTDIFRRALPWAKLLLTRGSLPNDLNLRWENRLSAMAVWSFLLILICSAMHPRLLPATLIPLALLDIGNRGLYRLFLRKGGFFFSLGAILLHWLHYLCASGAFLYLALEFWLRAFLGAAPQLRRIPAPRPLLARD